MYFFQSEMLNLKQNNERLQRMVGGSMSSMDMMERGVDPVPDIISTEDIGHGLNMANPDIPEDGKKITISVFFGQPHCFDRYYSEHYGGDTDGTGATGEVIYFILFMGIIIKVFISDEIEFILV